MSLSILSQATRDHLANMWKNEAPPEEISFLRTPGKNRASLKKWHTCIHTYLYERYIFHNDFFQLQQDNGRLLWSLECLIVLVDGDPKGENYSLRRWFEQGSCVKEEIEIPAIIPELDQELIRYYWMVLQTDHPLDYETEADSLQQLSLVVSAYWALSEPAFHYVSCHPRYPGAKENTKFNISFGVKGVEHTVFVAVYDSFTQRVDWMEVVGIPFTFLGMLVHENRLLTFIREEAPCRLQFLFEKS